MSRRYLDWIRPWNWSMRRWAGVLLAVMVASPFLTRWYCLWQVPDVALPFDEAEFLRYEDMAPEDDAFVTYLAASQLHETNRSIWRAQGTFTPDVWDAVRHAVATPDRPVDPQLVQWVEDNRQTLDLYRIGSQKRFAKGETLRTLDYDSALPYHNGIRLLAFLAQLKGLHCEQAGDFESAVQWHRLNLQCAHHAETPKIDVCRLIGMAIRMNACDGIAHWAESPFVSAPQLRAMRDEIETAASRRTKQLDCAIGEYLVCRNTLNRRDAANHLFPAWNEGIAAHPLWLPLKRLGLWIVGQPEITLRLERQLLLNNWNSIDLPLDKRPKVLDCQGSIVFDVRETRVPGQLEPSRLAEVANSSVRLTMMSSRHFDEAIHRDDSRLAAMIVLLACQEYYRDHGEMPSKLGQLVPGYLEQIPCDPMLATGVPMGYRRETDGNAIVWTVGVDGVDDGGDIRTLTHIKDEGRRIVAPVSVPSALTPSNILPAP